MSYRLNWLRIDQGTKKRIPQHSDHATEEDARRARHALMDGPNPPDVASVAPLVAKPTPIRAAKISENQPGWQGQRRVT